jgi:hypothetical protein
MSSSVLSMLQVQVPLYVLSIILILGNVGNCCSAIVFSRRRQNSCAMYLLGAALMDIIYLTFSSTLYLVSLQHVVLTSSSLVFCKLAFYLSQAWGQIGRYFIVLACVDRFVMTTNNIRLMVLNRPLVVRYIMVFVVLFWHIFPFHVLILSTITNGQCSQFGVYYIVYHIYLVVLLCIIPFASRSIFGILAYRNIKRLRTRVQPIDHITVGDGPNNMVHRRDRELFTMATTEAAVCVVTTIIYPVIVLEVSITNYMGISKSSDHLQIESFISTIGTILVSSNSAAPFYIYLAVSSTFRRDLKKLITKLRRSMVRRTGMPGNQGPVQLKS